MIVHERLPYTWVKVVTVRDHTHQPNEVGWYAEVQVLDLGGACGHRHHTPQSARDCGYRLAEELTWDRALFEYTQELTC